MLTPANGPPRPLRILHVTPAYFPATIYGGPIFSTKALFDGLAESGQVELDTLTTDSCGPSPSDRVKVPVNPFRFPAGYDVRYCRRVALASVSPQLLASLPGMIRRADLVHLTATYSFPTPPTLALARLFGKPVVWSPRGGLQATAQWADAPRRQSKILFERLCQALRPANCVLHVTAPMERDLSCDRLSGIGTAIIPNIIDVPENLPPRTWLPDGRLRLMFLSRLHPKKGIETLLNAMDRLPDNVTLDIFGDGEPGYVANLHRRAAPLGDRVRFHGHVEDAAKTRAFLEADLFCLPTHSENFGIVVGEALAHGVPVICTTGAPWQGLETEDCGAWIDNDTESLCDAIIRLAKADLAAKGTRGREWMQRDFSRAGVVARMLALYRDRVTGAPLPGMPQHGGVV